MMFMVKATTKGLIVAKPYGDSHRYDFLVDSGKRTWRVQVKSSTCTRCRAYTVNAYWKTTRKHMPYLPSKVDFLAVVILGTDIWYLIPVRALARRLMVRVYPFGGAIPEAAAATKNTAKPGTCSSPKNAPAADAECVGRPCGTDTPVRRL
jgi:hypothetical protein